MSINGLSWSEGGVELAVWVWPGCCSASHAAFTWTWTQREEPGTLTGSWPLLPFLLQQEGDSKGLEDSILGYFSGTWCWGEAVAWLPCVALQGQWSGTAWSQHPNGTILSCPGVQEHWKQQQMHRTEPGRATPTQMTQLPGRVVCHCFPLFWPGKC